MTKSDDHTIALMISAAVSTAVAGVEEKLRAEFAAELNSLGDYTYDNLVTVIEAHNGLCDHLDKIVDEVAEKHNSFVDEVASNTTTLGVRQMLADSTIALQSRVIYGLASRLGLSDKDINAVLLEVVGEPEAA